VFHLLTPCPDLQPTEIVILQSVSRRLLRLARDGPLWRFQCYYDSPKATINRIGQKSWSQALAQSLVGDQQQSNGHTCKNNKVRATDEWDLSDASEKVDWYSEYIARHAQLSPTWLDPQNSNYQDVRGAAFFDDGNEKRLVGPLEDGSLSVWNLSRKGGPSRHPRIFQKPARSLPGILFTESTANSESSRSIAKRALAVGDLLNEVDLNTLKVVAQTRYAWTITALSEIQIPRQPLTIGTSFSLHILDPRSPSRDRSCSPAGTLHFANSVAFFPNKDSGRNIHPARKLQIYPFNGFETRGFDPRPLPNTPVSASSDPDMGGLASYAQLEPAPLSILHQNDNSIMVAGRFPSILNYDRRYFPRLEYVIHSSARLSALAYLPFSPRGIRRSSSSESQGTLISCGEYNGRGSLELYSVPSTSSLSSIDPWPSKEPTPVDILENDTTAADIPSNSNSSSSNTSTPSFTPPNILSYKNRQSISSAKLLSVATQGTRIVFSDADGGLKWVERDGRTIARRWNINSHQLHQESFPRVGRSNDSNARQAQWFEAGIHGEEVVRKIVPTGTGEADDLLVWTGERVGLVGFGRNDEFYDAEDGAGGMDDVVKTFDGLVDSDRRRGEGGNLEEAAQEYDRQMRRALERQADELNWMHRFGFRSSP
jgi:hypothetical protein